MLATALRQRALLHQHFKTPKLRVRAVQPRAARYPSGIAIAYLVGLRGFLDVVRKALEREVLPQLPRLLVAHAQTKPRADGGTKRIAIVGAPRAGKTTKALELGDRLGLPVHHSDDLIKLGWSEASAELARQITESSSGIFEGVAVVRALRKMMGNGPDRPVDSVMILRDPHVPLNDGQARMATACETILREIEPELRARGVEIVHGDVLAVARTDNTGDSAEDLFDQVTAAVNAEVTPTRIALLAQQNALRVSEHTKNELAAQVKQVVKIDLFAPDTGIAENIEAFVAQNVLQIKGLTDSAIKTAHATLLQGARDGLRVEEVAKQLKAGLKVSDKRAAFLASDQIGSLNGELTQLRQTSLGIKRYKWSTSNDEKVRHDHAILNGTIQLWAKPPVVNQKTGFRANPGRDRRCRCSGIPVLDDLLREAGLLPANDVAPDAGEPKLPDVSPALPRPQPVRAAPAAPPPPPSPPESPPTPPKLPPVPSGLPQPLPANAGPAREKARTNPKPTHSVFEPRGEMPTATAVPELPAAVRPPAWMTEPEPHVTRNPADVVRDKGQSEAHILTFQTPEGEKKGLWKPLNPDKPYTLGSEISEAAASSLDRLLHGQLGAVVPPTVARELGGRRGSLQEIVPNLLGSAKELTHKIALDPATWATQASTRKMFVDDVLTRNIDRHHENVLFTRSVSGSPVAHAIDNAYSFRTVGEYGKYDPRFAFPVEHPAFVNTLMDLDPASVATIQAIKPAEVAGLLRAHGVDPAAIRETLVRVKSLQKDPSQLRALIGSTVEETQVNLSQWLGQSAEAHGLTASEAAELMKLVEGE